MTILAVASSDWHLAQGAWRSRDILGDAFHGLRQLVDFAIAHGASVLAAGDLYDVDDPDPVTVREMETQIARLERARIPLVYIVGQHERHRAGTWLGVSDWPVHLHGHPYVLPNSVRVCGWDWVPASGLEAAIAALPRDVLDDPAGICLTHQVWSEFLRFDGQAEGSLAMIPGRCAVVAGDYHGLVGDGSSRALWAGEHLVLSPGSLALQSVDEPAEKQFWVLEEVASGERVWRPQPLATRPVIRFRLECDSELADLPDAVERELAAASTRAEALPPALRRPILAVWFPETMTGVPAALQQFRTEAHVFIRPISRRRAAAAAAGQDLRRPAARSLIEGLDLVVPRGDPRRPDLERLLAAADPAAELAAIKQEFFEERREHGNGSTAGGGGDAGPDV